MFVLKQKQMSAPHHPTTPHSLIKSAEYLYQVSWKYWQFKIIE